MYKAIILFVHSSADIYFKVSTCSVHKLICCVCGHDLIGKSC